MSSSIQDCARCPRTPHTNQLLLLLLVLYYTSLLVMLYIVLRQTWNRQMFQSVNFKCELAWEELVSKWIAHFRAGTRHSACLFNAHVLSKQFCKCVHSFLDEFVTCACCQESLSSQKSCWLSICLGKIRSLSPLRELAARIRVTMCFHIAASW